MPYEEGFEKIDARLEAIAMNLDLTAAMAHANEARIEKLGNRIEKLLVAIEKDGENISALARFAEIREHRLSELEGGDRTN
jgi:hypothetical protein